MGEVVSAILERMFKGYEATSLYFQNEGKDKIKKYFQSLFWIFLISFIPSLPLIYYGIYYDSSWALVIGGIWRAVCTLLLMLAATPIGLIYEIATGGVTGSGQRYIRRVSGVFISELLFILIVSLIPISNNPKMFPIFILASLLFGFISSMSMSREMVSVIVGGLLIGIILSFYFPYTFSEVKIGIKGCDMEISKPIPIKFKLDDYKAGRVEFFYANGKPRVWYVELEDGKIELLNKKGTHTTWGIDSKEINRSIVENLKKSNWENLSPNNIIKEQSQGEIQPVPTPPPPVPDTPLPAPDVPPSKKEEEPRMDKALEEPDNFVLRPTECRGGYGMSLSVRGGEIDPDGTIKIRFLQHAENQVEYFAILNPEFDTYLTDQDGNRYEYVSIEGMAHMDVPNQRGKFTKIVSKIPIQYTITFNAKNKKPKSLNFTSTYYTPDIVGVLFFKKTVACPDIKVVPGSNVKISNDVHKNVYPKANVPNNFEPNTRWVGYYVCNQGLTDLVLEILKVEGDIIIAKFIFFHAPSRANGSFYLNGQYDARTRRFVFLPENWIDRPPGYRTVGMTGVILDNPRRFDGKIDISGCGAFSVKLEN